jgi:hypothetical protein
MVRAVVGRSKQNDNVVRLVPVPPLHPAVEKMLLHSCKYSYDLHTA